MRVAGGILTAVLAGVYVVLALQAEPVTATIGYVCATLLTVALIQYVRKGGN